MKLKYKILWFDDQPGQISSLVRSVEKHVAKLGFSPEVEIRSVISHEEVDELADTLDGYNPYDIIVFDYDLGRNSANGIDIAQALRSKIYTDLIFYSGSGIASLREKLFRNEVDGVFLVGRDDFLDDIEPIIDDHIKKMSDINNIRGVMMSEVSDMDLDLRDYLHKILDDLDATKSEELLRSFKVKYARDSGKRLGSIQSKESFQEMLQDPHSFTLEHIRLLLKSIFKDDSKVNFFDNNQTLHNAQMERNKLAHNRDEYTKDGKLILHLHKGEIKEYDFDEFRRVRHDLLAARKGIRDLP